MKFNFFTCFISCISIIFFLFILLIVLSISYYKNLKSDSERNDNDKAAVEQNDYPIIPNKTRIARFLILSDTESDFDSVQKFVKISQTYDPDAVMHTGDITYLGVRSDMDTVKGLFANYPYKIFYVPGDRDLWKGNGPSIFKQVFGADYQIVEVKGIKLMLINNADEYEGIDTTQFEFIRANISTVDYVFMHNPIVFNDSLLGIMQKGMGQYSGEVDKQRLELVDLIQKSNVKATFAGDQHVYSLTADPVKPKLMHIVVGALTTDRNIRAPSFVVFDVYEDGTVGIEDVALLD